VGLFLEFQLLLDLLQLPPVVFPLVFVQTGVFQFLFQLLYSG